jgi:pimeloyl-ACP methyl ester carboxylesterase
LQTRSALGGLSCPVLVAVGDGDVVGGPGPELAALIPGAQAFVILGRDHMKAVGDRTFKEAVFTFLDGQE